MLQQFECPVCGKPTKVLFDHEANEMCCSECGYVLDEPAEAYADDPAKKPKYATLAVSALGCAPPKLKGVTLPMYEDDIEYRVGRNISLFLSLLGLPSENSNGIYMDAQKIAQSIISQQRQHRDEIKLTVQEIAALALWQVISERRLPIPLKTFERKLSPSFTKRLRLFKIMKRVTWLEILNINAQSSPADYISSIIRDASPDIEHQYLSVVECYARKMVTSPESSWIIGNREPVLIAAAAVHAADSLVGRMINPKQIAKAAGVGEASMKRLALAFKQNRPALPAEALAYKVTAELNGGVLDATD